MKADEKPSDAGSKSIDSDGLSGNFVHPNRSAITELSLSTQVLLIARSGAGASGRSRRVDEPVRIRLPGDVVRARLVGPVVQVEAGQRHLVGELVLELPRCRLLEAVGDRRASAAS